MNGEPPGNRVLKKINQEHREKITLNKVTANENIFFAKKKKVITHITVFLILIMLIFPPLMIQFEINV